MKGIVGKCFNPFKGICGNSASYSKPFDKQAIAKVVNRLLTEKDTRDGLVRKGLKKVKTFSLEKTAM